MPTLKIKRLYADVPMPKRARSDDSGIDLTAIRVEKKRDRVFFFDLGVSIEPPDGYYTELFPRSSIYKRDFIMANSVGIIDPGYRGALMMPMRHVGAGEGEEEALSMIGQRIGQLIVKRLEPVNIEIVDELADSRRGQDGFGSSGV